MTIGVLGVKAAIRFLCERAKGELPKVIAISGGTCSGKTTFASKLKSVLQDMGISVRVVPLDSYYKDHDDPGFPKDKQKRHLLDVPGAFFGNEFLADISALAYGNSVRIPVYHLPTNKRLIGQSVSLCPAQTIIAEGLFAGYFMLRSTLPVFYIFIDTPAEVCLERRIERDTRLYGVSPSQVRVFFRSRILPYWEEYASMQRQSADLVIS